MRRDIIKERDLVSGAMPPHNENEYLRKKDFHDLIDVSSYIGCNTATC